jgi:hypothetical protein
MPIAEMGRKKNLTIERSKIYVNFDYFLDISTPFLSELMSNSCYSDIISLLQAFVEFVELKIKTNNILDI